MTTETKTDTNVKQAVPFFLVSNIEVSVGYYVDGLGFEMTKQWVVEGNLRWCWLDRGGASLMLQEFWKEGDHGYKPEGKLGEGVSICFICEDALALYREFRSKGIQVSTPFVGNAMWVTSLSDPDGFRLDFESFTDAPEESVYTEPEGEDSN